MYAEKLCPKRSFKIWSLCAILGFASTPLFAEQAKFGADMPAGSSMRLTEALQLMQTTGKDSLDGVKITGTVTEVCQKKGCWMILTDASHYARIRFKDYKFFVPKDASQSTATVYGSLTQQGLSKKMQAHYAQDAANAKDAGNSAAPVSEMEYSFMAESVILEAAK